MPRGEAHCGWKIVRWPHDLAGAVEGAAGRREGLAFLGFPLHAAKKPSSERAEHLAGIAIPMLFLQGTRDELADLGHLKPVIASLGAKATLHEIEGGDHSFAVLKKSGRTNDEALTEVLDTLAAWIDQLA